MPAGNGQMWTVPSVESMFSKRSNVKDIGISITPENPSAPPETVLTLANLPDIIQRSCPLLERLKVSHFRHCSLWEFALHLDGIFRLDCLEDYEFTWRGGPITKFLGDYASPSQRTEALEKLLPWSDVYGTSRLIKIFGVDCVCKDGKQKCPHPDACAALEEFLEFCTNHGIPVTKM